MSRNQSAEEALVSVRLRQIRKDIKKAQTVARKALRAAAKPVREQLRFALKLKLQDLAADLKIEIKQSDLDVAQQFRAEAEAAAAAKTLSRSVARRDLREGEHQLQDFGPTYAEPMAATTATTATQEAV